MGFFKGIGELIVSPVRVVTKTANNVVNKEWSELDACTFGVTKVLEAIGEEAEEIEEAFEDD